MTCAPFYRFTTNFRHVDQVIFNRDQTRTRHELKQDRLGLGSTQSVAKPSEFVSLRLEIKLTYIFTLCCPQRRLSDSDKFSETRREVNTSRQKYTLFETEFKVPFLTSGRKQSLISDLIRVYAHNSDIDNVVASGSETSG